MSDVMTYGDTLDVDCPRCKAAAGSRCVNPQTGHIAHCPCLARCVDRPIRTAKRSSRNSR